MRLIYVFFLSTFINYAVGQTTQDTTIMLQTKAKIYLTKMYSEQNFDTAFSMWDKRMRSEVKDIYQKNGRLFINDSLLDTQIKNDYKYWYSTLKDFRLLNFEDQSISEIGNTTIYYFKYSFEKGRTLNSSVIGLAHYKQSHEWKILDMWTLSILQGPMRISN